jgi:hypothetical protein
MNGQSWNTKDGSVNLYQLGLEATIVSGYDPAG